MASNCYSISRSLLPSDLELEVLFDDSVKVDGSETEIEIFDASLLFLESVLWMSYSGLKLELEIDMSLILLKELLSFLTKLAL